MNAFAICYGIFATFCTPAALDVPAGIAATLPGGITISAPGEERLTAVATLPDGFVWTAAGGSNGPAITADGVAIVASTSDGEIDLTGLEVSGSFGPGDALDVNLRVFNPNSGAVLHNGPLRVSEVRGVTDVLLLTLNPSANDTQQTFLRLINPGPNEALVRLRPTDDAGVAGGEVELLLRPGEALQVTSDDLERGNADKGLSGAFGDGSGKWRVRLVADQTVVGQVLVRNRTDGTLSALQAF